MAPSLEQAMRVPSSVQAASTTERRNAFSSTRRGLPPAGSDHTDRDLSRLPTAKRDTALPLRERKHRGWHLMHPTAFLKPTRSLPQLQSDLLIMRAVGPPLFIAQGATSQAPSGDQLIRQKREVEVDSLKGSARVRTHSHPSVFHTFNELSSAWVAKYLPVGSHDSPLTPLEHLSTATRSHCFTPQMITVLSREHEAISCPQGDQSTWRTSSE